MLHISLCIVECECWDTGRTGWPRLAQWPSPGPLRVSVNMRTAGSDLAWLSHIPSPSAPVSLSAQPHNTSLIVFECTWLKWGLSYPQTLAVTLPQQLLFLQALSECMIKSKRTIWLNENINIEACWAASFAVKNIFSLVLFKHNTTWSVVV